MSILTKQDFTYISGLPAVEFMEECAKIATSKPRGDNAETQFDYAIYDILEYIDKNLSTTLNYNDGRENAESPELPKNLAQKWFAKTWNRESKDPAEKFLTDIEKRANACDKTNDTMFSALFNVLAIVDSCGATQDYYVQFVDSASRVPLNDVFHELLSDAIHAYESKQSKKKI